MASSWREALEPREQVEPLQLLGLVGQLVRVVEGLELQP